MRRRSEPAVVIAVTSAAGKKIPLFVSPEVVIAGAAALPAENVATPDALSVVNAPVDGVVAPTVPLMLIEAVPVRFVTVPLDGVPRAPPFTTKAPDDPVFTPRAVTTPVPVVVELIPALEPFPISNEEFVRVPD